MQNEDCPSCSGALLDIFVFAFDRCPGDMSTLNETDLNFLFPDVVAINVSRQVFVKCINSCVCVCVAEEVNFETLTSHASKLPKYIRVEMIIKL